jgi:DNA-binding NarL/FixJ family response regulator
MKCLVEAWAVVKLHRKHSPQRIWTEDNFPTDSTQAVLTSLPKWVATKQLWEPYIGIVKAMAALQTDVIRAAVVEDMKDIRDGLTTLINFTEGFRCTGGYRSMEEALARLGDDVPDVLLSDIGLPGMSGIEGIRIIKERYPEMQILMLTVYTDDDRIFDALCAGASGYLLKRTPPAKLLENIREAMSGGSPVSPEVAARVIRFFREFHNPDREDYQLTPHETRLLKLLTEGYNYQTAAEKLGVSYNTIKFHVRHIFDKLQVHSKSEAVVKAMRDRLV